MNTIKGICSRCGQFKDGTTVYDIFICEDCLKFIAGDKLKKK